MKHHETQVRQLWDSVVDELDLEEMERKLQEAERCVNAAREVQFASVNVHTFARKMECKIVATGLRRVWQMRCAGKFKLADEALQMMQKYLCALHETERQAADSGLAQEEIFACMERWAQAHEATLPKVPPRLWPDL